MAHLHISYLQQASEILQEDYKPLAARLNNIAKRIAAKHVIKIKSVDSPKLMFCKTCQAPFTCDNFRVGKKESIIVKCSLCELTRRYKITEKK